MEVGGPRWVEDLMVEVGDPWVEVAMTLQTEVEEGSRLGVP